jgi:hypothetical protein
LEDKYFYGWYPSEDVTEMKKKFISTKQDNGDFSASPSPINKKKIFIEKKSNIFANS